MTDTLAATLHDPDAAGAVIDAAAAAGGNEAVVTGIRFDREEDSALVEAAASGRGPMPAAGRSSSPRSPGSGVPMGAEGEGTGFPVLPGQQPVSVVIEVAFAIG